MADIVLDEFFLQTTVNETVILEKRIRILLQPKPEWVPTFIWYTILCRVLKVEIWNL